MPARFTRLVAVSWLLLAAACEQQAALVLLTSGDPGAQTSGQLSNTTCLGFDAPRPEDLRVELAEAFGGERFSSALALRQHPSDDDRWYVVQQSGTIVTFLASDPQGSRAVAAQVPDLQTGGERGLLGMAFHPDFDSNGEVYLSYIARAGSSPGDSVIARYESQDGGLSFTPHADLVVLQLRQPASNHNGGDLAFGPDGYLYASFGDGGGSNDRYRNGQNLDSIFGGVIRIDVSTHPYVIPADNPLIGVAGAEELYAYGLRNPWRMSFDSASGDLWLGDVGQNSFEEIDRIEAGGNYGWPLKEGFSCFEAPAPCDALPGVLDPVVDYGRSGGAAVSGGYVYHGDDIPGLAGAYVYGDYGSGKIWGLFDPTGSAPLAVELIDTGLRVSAFGQGRDGEIYALDLAGAGAPIQQLVPVSGTPPIGGGPPMLLSETGCVDPADPSQLASGVVPYDVNAPLWSDGVAKRRGLAIPNATLIQQGADGDLDFPIGSVLVKHFIHQGAYIETRLMVHHEDGSWAGYSYEWNTQGTEATLLADALEVDVGGLMWSYPSPAQCLQCHTPGAGFSIGPELAQLDRDFDYGASEFELVQGVANQLDALAALGVFAAPPSDTVVPLPALDAAASAEERARAYLHANCSYCHRPGETPSTAMDLRYETPLLDAGICDAMPLIDDLGLQNARLVAPGLPGSSVLLARMRDTGVHRMPPLGSIIVDDEAADVVEAWITGLSACP